MAQANWERPVRRIVLKHQFAPPPNTSPRVELSSQCRNNRPPVLPLPLLPQRDILVAIRASQKTWMPGTSRKGSSALPPRPFCDRLAALPWEKSGEPRSVPRVGHRSLKERPSLARRSTAHCLRFYVQVLASYVLHRFVALEWATPSLQAMGYWHANPGGPKHVNGLPPS